MKTIEGNKEYESYEEVPVDEQRDDRGTAAEESDEEVPVNDQEDDRVTAAEESDEKVLVNDKKKDDSDTDEEESDEEVCAHCSHRSPLSDLLPQSDDEPAKFYLSFKEGNVQDANNIDEEEFDDTFPDEKDIGVILTGKDGIERGDFKVHRRWKFIDKEDILLIACKCRGYSGQKDHSFGFHPLSVAHHSYLEPYIIKVRANGTGKFNIHTDMLSITKNEWVSIREKWPEDPIRSPRKPNHNETSTPIAPMTVTEETKDEEESDVRGYDLESTEVSAHTFNFPSSFAHSSTKKTVLMAGHRSMPINYPPTKQIIIKPLLVSFMRMDASSV